jgi:predicted nucleic acid-binding protein
MIDAERQKFDVARFLKHIAPKIGNHKTALSVISIAELAHGVHRANTPERRDSRRAFLDDLKATVPVYPITADTAELVGKINAERSASGVIIPFDDLLIGVTALERNYAVATHNDRHFKKIPNLKILSL